jgi:hypothetical protein
LLEVGMLVALVAPGAEPLAAAARRQATLPRHRARPRVVPPPAPLAAPDLMTRDELLAAVRAWEGEALEQPPFLFKATVAVGTAMLAGAGLLVLGLGG